MAWEQTSTVARRQGIDFQDVSHVDAFNRTGDSLDYSYYPE
jgi:hypothetical protein